MHPATDFQSGSYSIKFLKIYFELVVNETKYIGRLYTVRRGLESIERDKP